MVLDAAPVTEAEVLRRGSSALLDRLPAGWTARPVDEPSIGDRRADLIVEVTAPGGESVTLVFEVKGSVEGRDVSALRRQLDSYVQLLTHGEGVVVARYLSPPVRKRLAEEGMSYVDATGNVRVHATSPGLFISDRGADHDPWRGPGRPRGTMKGAPAAKIARAVADFAGPWTMRQLIDVSGVSTGATYRVVDYLQRGGLAFRDDNGAVLVPDWAAVLRRWSDDYGFVRSNPITRWIAPRGLPDLMSKAAQTAGGYAVTGTLAAEEWAASAPARSAMIYTSDAAKMAEQWGLRSADAGANVMLAEPEIDVVFARTLTNQEGVTIAAPTQVVVDLLTGPGRAPSEGEDLLAWMQRNEGSWRS